jgi:hypothetical protein
MLVASESHQNYQNGAVSNQLTDVWWEYVCDDTLEKKVKYIFLIHTLYISAPKIAQTERLYGVKNHKNPSD